MADARNSRPRASGVMRTPAWSKYGNASSTIRAGSAILSRISFASGLELVPRKDFYDYEAKYAPGGSKHILPAPILPFVYQEVRRLALKAHHALGCRGVTRADFRYDDQAAGTEGLAPGPMHSGGR